MALVDFYQLAVLHNLSRCYAGVLSDPSHPPMSPVTQSSSRSPAVKSDRPNSHFPLSTQLEHKTPRRKRDLTQSVGNLTPTCRGTSILHKLRQPKDRPEKCKSSKYEEYIIQDFENHRVFVDIDVFMKHVLHVPDDWKEQWGRTIRRIKRDGNFSIAYLEYSRECEIPGAGETRFYKPLVDMTNAILDFSAEDQDESVMLRTPQRYLRNDPRKVRDGVISELTPDIVAVHDELLADTQPEELGEWNLERSNLTWAQPLQVLEVKPSDGALVDGSCMPRLKVNGEYTTASRDDSL